MASGLWVGGHIIIQIEGSMIFPILIIGIGTTMAAFFQTWEQCLLQLTSAQLKMVA